MVQISGNKRLMKFLNHRYMGIFWKHKIKFFFTSQMSKRNESKKPQIKEQADKTMKDTNIIF